jgi:hypothetical protein
MVQFAGVPSRNRGEAASDIQTELMTLVLRQ